jgi:antitoxin ParD1/3/4
MPAPNGDGHPRPAQASSANLATITNDRRRPVFWFAERLPRIARSPILMGTREDWGTDVMAAADRLNITLPRDLAELVRSKVRTGDYASSSEVIRAALRVWQEREEFLARKRDWLRAKIDHSLSDPGASLDAEAVFTDLEALYGDE